MSIPAERPAVVDELLEARHGGVRNSTGACKILA
jgi:hypothetical protein